MWRILSCSVILRSTSLQYLMLVLIISSLDLSVCEYADVEFLFSFGETSANTLDMKYFLHINAKLFDALSMVTMTNFRWSSSKCLLTSESFSTGFVCFGLIFCLSSVQGSCRTSKILKTLKTLKSDQVTLKTLKIKYFSMENFENLEIRVYYREAFQQYFQFSFLQCQI